MQAFGFYCSVVIRAFKTSFPPVYPSAHREGPWALGVIQFKCMQFKCVLQIADSCYWEAHWLPSDDTWWILIVFKHFSSIFIKRSRLQNPSKRLQNPSKRLQKPSNAYKSQKVGQMGFSGIWKNVGFSVWPPQKLSLEQAWQQCLAARVSPTFPRDRNLMDSEQMQLYSFAHAVMEQSRAHGGYSLQPCKWTFWIILTNHPQILLK